jgi:hypothetical protein
MAWTRETRSCLVVYSMRIPATQLKNNLTSLNPSESSRFSELFVRMQKPTKAHPQPYKIFQRHRVRSRKCESTPRAHAILPLLGMTYPLRSYMGLSRTYTKKPNRLYHCGTIRFPNRHVFHIWRHYVYIRTTCIRTSSLRNGFVDYISGLLQILSISRNCTTSSSSRVTDIISKRMEIYSLIRFCGTTANICVPSHYQTFTSQSLLWQELCTAVLNYRRWISCPAVRTWYLFLVVYGLFC